MKNFMELDIVKQEIGGKKLIVSTATTSTVCDFCGDKLGGSYPRYGAVSVNWPRASVANDMSYDYDSYANQKHFCGMGCMAAYANKQDDDDGIVHDYNDDEKNEKESKARDIPTKTRNHLKSSQFVDEKRRSFPIENCEDVKAAVHAWGRYKGSMSFEEFKSKLSAKAKALGCSLPESWSGDKK